MRLFSKMKSTTSDMLKEPYRTGPSSQSPTHGPAQQDSRSTGTDLIPNIDEYYANRVGDLAGGRPQQVAGRKRKAPEPAPSPPKGRSPSLEAESDSDIDFAQVLADLQDAGILPPDSDSGDNLGAETHELADVTMAEGSQATQQATQPVEDPRRLGRHLSDISNDDLSDVICILHPQTACAIQAIPATMLTAPQHILQNQDLEGITEDDLLQPEYQEVRDVALRLSSKVKSPSDGFVFGRNPNQCDVLLTDDLSEKLVSNRHFKIYINSHGSLMVQDLSTNGTIVDDDILRSKAKRGMQKPPTRVLKNGTILGVVCGPTRAEVKFLVRIPNRGDHEDMYGDRLRKYLEARGTVANFASMRESSYGNFWNGGSEYNFTGNLGKGAFATVYRVQTKRDGHIFAAKEIDKRRFIKNGQLDVKFDNELKIMQNLTHPNIVEYVDSHNHGHHIYIIMECISGGELQTELRARSSLSEPEVQQITRQITHALQYLHRRGITHRDIKPDNILIASRSPLVVKLSDFGLSKCVADQETFLKTFCGTLLYCAPEIYPDYSMYAGGMQTKRRRVGEHAPRISPYSEAVDMWSFGAVIFHLLCGKPPITGKGDDRGAQMLNNIMTKDVDFEPLRSAGISEAGVDFVRQLLNRNPHLRPNEADCLKHPWLLDIPDIFKYEDGGPEPEVIRRALDAIQEIEEEDDLQMLEEVHQLTQPPVRQDSLPSMSPLRPTKKRRLSEEQLVSSGIQYPALPSLAPSPSSTNPTPAGGRLFGEITPSVIRSSGVFGDSSAPFGPPAMPKIQQRVENISVNDFRSRQDGSSEMSVDDVSLQQFPDPPTKGNAEELPHGSAPSLLGAEAQIGQLNVASPEAEVADGNTPETGNPVRPKTRELSPSSSVSGSAENSQHNRSHQNQLGKFNRQIDLNLLENEMAYEAELRAREESRAEKKQKAETFAVQLLARQAPSFELAATIDAVTGREVRHTARSAAQIEGLQSPTVRLDDFPFAKPPRRFGKLTTVSGSYTNVTVTLEDRGTLWGRSPTCNVQYPNVKDVRIPKVAMRIIFWAPGMEAHENTGGDWTEVPGIQTVISTSASAGILVNGVKLMEKAKDDDAALYGKIYTGDIVTIYESADRSTFLKFKVEITYGSSALERPEKEKPFQFHREKKYYGEYVLQRESMRKSMREKDANLAITNGAADATTAKSA